MKTEEKSGNKEKQALIIRKYKQFLKLEKGLSPNTLDAYQTDLFKLLHFLEGGETDVLNVSSMSFSPCSTTSASIRAHKPVSFQASSRSSTSWFWPTIARTTPAN